jgi:hypothetical protein
MKNIYLEILELQSSHSPLVLATVVRTQGSTPQKPGCSALFNEMGLVTGTVGGGIVEGKVQNLAAELIVSEHSGLYHFNLGNDISNLEEAICGGQIDVLIDLNISNFTPVFEQLNQSLKNNNPGVLITEVTGSNKTTVMINRYWISEISKPSIPADLLTIIEPEFTKLILEKNPSGFCEGSAVKVPFFSGLVSELVDEGVGRLTELFAGKSSDAGFDLAESSTEAAASEVFAGEDV